jgi:hypothetical protein
MRMPAADFAKLEGLLKPQGRKFQDCSNLIQRVRLLTVILPCTNTNLKIYAATIQRMKNKDEYIQS